MKSALLFLALAMPTILAKNFGGININGVGTIYVVGPDWASNYVQVTGNELHLNGGGRIYFAKTPNDGFSADMFWKTPLDNKRFSYTVDVSRVECHCNSAAYFIEMPVNNNAGGGGDYYCDANFGNNIWCPEYDTWEGNKHTMASALHICYGQEGNWDSCDRGGCNTNAFNVNSNYMCPEDRCTINTMRPFTVSHFQTAGKVTNTLEQEGRSVQFDVCGDGNILNQMARSYNNMVFSASLWGGPDINMDWLDGMTGCWGSCNVESNAVTFSNFSLM